MRQSRMSVAGGAAAACALFLLFGAMGCNNAAEEQQQAAAEGASSTPAGETASADTSGGKMMGPPSPPGDGAAGDGVAPAGGELMPKGDGKIATTASGLKYEEIKEGKGRTPKTGDVVAVHYTGVLESGEKFDSSRDRGEPIVFPIGTGQVIPGWDEGVMSMKVGGRRKLIIPADLGYGPSGQGPIPPNATLIFDVELVEIKNPPQK